MPGKRGTDQRLPLEAWPPDMKERWNRALTQHGWRGQTMERRLRAAKLLFFTSIAPPSPETWQTFVASLAERFSPATVRSYVQDASYAVRALWPEHDWLWLVESQRHQKARPRRPAKTVEYHGRLLHRLPTIWQQRWQAYMSDANGVDDFRRAYEGGETDGSVRGDPQGEHSWTAAYRARLLRGGAYYGDFIAATSRSLEVTRASVDAYIGWLADRGLAPVSVGMHVEELARLVTEVVEPGTPRPWLTGLAQALKRRARPRRHKAYAHPNDLLALGHSLMAEARQMTVGVQAAIRYRDGLLLSYQALRGHRISNLADMRIGETVTKGPSGWTVAFARTKNGTSWCGGWPGRLHDQVEVYITRYRPLLAPRDSGLWCGRDGLALTPGTLTRRLGDITMKRLGKRISCQWFRDGLATAAAFESPEAVAPTAAVLAHSPQVLDKHYNHAVSAAAARALAETLAETLARVEPQKW